MFAIRTILDCEFFVVVFVVIYAIVMISLWPMTLFFVIKVIDLALKNDMSGTTRRFLCCCVCLKMFHLDVDTH